MKSKTKKDTQTAKKYDFAEYQKSGSTFLAAQPDTAPLQTADKGWNVLRGHLEGRLAALRNWRQSWWMLNWSNLAKYILPRRSIWMTQSAGGFPSPNNMTRGREINSAIEDPTATYAVRVCSAGLMSGLASPSRPWFKVVPSIRKTQLDDDARAWMDETEDRIYTVLAGSNFYNAFAQECEDLTVFGTGPNIIYEDERDLIRCYTPAVGEYFLASNATLRVDTLYRAFVMTTSEVVDFFGIDNCTPDIQKAWEAKGPELQVERIIAHSIEPNFSVGPNGEGKLPGKYTWREVYWVFGSASVAPLSMRGFYDQPFTAARWSTQSNDAYGRSVCMDVLPDVLQLQVMTRRMAEAIEKQVRPPLLANMELKNQPASALPGHVTYVSNPENGMRPMYTVNPDIRAMAENIALISQRIQRGLFNDLFLMLEQNPTKEQTAYEVAQKVQEKLQVIGPVIENILAESLKPKLKRIFAILQRKGIISPLPPSLKGVALDVEFVSMLALAQRAASTGGMERLIALVGNMVGVYPNVKDNLDPDKFLTEMNDLLGNPQHILRGPDSVAQIRQQAQQQQEQAQKMVQMQHMAQTAQTGAQAAQVMSQTDIGAGQNVLGKVLGTQ